MGRKVGVVARMLRKRQLPDDARLFQQPQRSIHRSQGDIRKKGVHPLENLPNRGMVGGIDHHLGNGQALGRKAYAQRPEPGCQLFLRSQNG